MRGTPIVLTGVLLAVAAACAPPPGEQPVTLHPLTPSSAAAPSTSPSPEPSPTPSPDEEAAVEALYVDWQEHLGQSQDMSRSTRRTFFGKWLVDPALTTYTEGVQRHKDQHMRYEGERIPHILAIDVADDGRAATVRDCNDVRGLRLVDSRTGKRLPGTPTWLEHVAELKQTPEGWRIYQVKVTVDEKCAKRITSSPSPS